MRNFIVILFQCHRFLSIQYLLYSNICKKMNHIETFYSININFYTLVFNMHALYVFMYIRVESCKLITKQLSSTDSAWPSITEIPIFYIDAFIKIKLKFKSKKLFKGNLFLYLRIENNFFFKSDSYMTFCKSLRPSKYKLSYIPPEQTYIEVLQIIFIFKLTTSNF